MRSRALRGLIGAGVVVCALSARAEQMPPVMVTFDDAPAIAVGQAVRLPVVVRVTPDQGHPLLLTARAQGTAVEVVRERLLRRDARPDDTGALRFSVPVFGAEAGDGIVRVEVETYRCFEGRCQQVHGEATLQTRVSPAAPESAER